ncbi:hypothetical protein CHS0354_037894 [Potamilus streckersoni]|uniref:Uncharacterized protein n=1 Tax=Potamilus streckersoni TaxID=2493646 RepID=A0AAE0T990_9BIVA|nr:hypothetical protein CHS0354_037894 [Potamilus streckersoni]
MGNQQILGGPILPTSCIPGYRQIMNAASGSRNSQVLDLEADTEEESITSDDEVEEKEEESKLKHRKPICLTTFKVLSGKKRNEGKKGTAHLLQTVISCCVVNFFHIDNSMFN